jgi:hypothetical protein
LRYHYIFHILQTHKVFRGIGGEAIYIDTEGSFMVERAAQMADALVAHIRKNGNKMWRPSAAAAASGQQLQGDALTATVGIAPSSSSSSSSSSPSPASWRADAEAFTREQVLQGIHVYRYSNSFIKVPPASQPVILCYAPVSLLPFLNSIHSPIICQSPRPVRTANNNKLHGSLSAYQAKH